MAERASVFQGIQYGLEVTPGTAVAADKKLTSLSIVPTPEIEIPFFRPFGNKFNTVSQLGKDYTTAALSGQATYNEIGVVLAAGLATPTTTGPASTYYTHAGEIDSDGPDTLSAMTVEMGSPVQAERFTYGLVSSFSLDFDRDGVRVGGAMIGQELETGITLTGSPTELALVPIMGGQGSVYVDTTSGGLGTTKLGRVLKGTFTFGDRLNALWVVDAAQPSFVAHVESPPTATFKMMIEADAAGMAFLANARAGDTRFIRVSFVGTGTYSLRFDMAAKLGKPDAFADDNNVYAIGLNWTLVHDGTWGKALAYQLVNKVAL